MLHPSSGACYLPHRCVGLHWHTRAAMGGGSTFSSSAHRQWRDPRQFRTILTAVPMRLTPLDIQQKQFKQRFRGEDPHEVRQFLQICADEMEELVRETIELREDVRARDAMLAELREREKSLQDALVSAQKVAAELKEQARKEAEIVIADAELQAERIIQDAHSRRSRLLEEVAELRREKAAFSARIRSAVEAQLKLLETFEEADRAEDESKVTLLQKKAEQG